MLIRFTQIDYDREMALVALPANEPSHFVAVARYFPNPDRSSAEFAVAVADSWQGRGLGHQIMLHLIECARAAGYAELNGIIRSDNAEMLVMMRNLGFATHLSTEEAGIVQAVMRLSDTQ